MVAIPIMLSAPARLLRTYVLALGAIAFLAIGSQVVVQEALGGGGSSAEAINVAGRQRMLSQRIAKAALAIHGGARGEATAELTEALEDFEAAHAMLSAHPDNGERVAQMYSELQPSFARLHGVASRLATGEVPEEDPTDAILAAAGDFLPRMHAIVDAHQAESDARLATIRRLELVLLLTTLVVLLLEATLVFEPMRRALAAHVRDLEEARNEALEAARAKDEFLATMSHEIRTPLHGVVGMNELLLDTELQEDQKELAESASRSATTLMSLLNDVLDYAKLSSQEVELETIPFDLHEWLSDAVAPLSFQVDQDAVEVLIDVADDLPAQAVGDPTRLRQVLMNLAGNAAKFTEEGHVLVRAQYGADPRGAEGEGLSLSVEDTGIGIAQERLEAIFDRFQQADSSSTRRFGGTGLGLAIVREIVTRMGGWVEARSVEGEGTTFELWVPLATAGPEAASCAPDLTGRTAWVIDDHPLNRSYAERCLARWGAEAVLFDSAAAALEAMESGIAPPDVLLIDFNMPGMDGAAFARIVSERPGWADVQRILLSSAGTGPSDDACADLFQMRVLKPFVPGTLARVLSTAFVRAGASPRSQEDAPLRHEGLRVLLVEDNAVNLRLGIRFLDSMGCVTKVAENGERALEVAAEHEFDVVLMDCQMPVMDGYAAATAMRGLEATRELPIIALTANSDEASRKRCRDAGMDDFLSKPYGRAALHAVLERWKGARAGQAA